MNNDQELLRRYIETRDGAAFAELVERYAPMVYATCLRSNRNRADAEDAAQETLLQLARKPESVRSHLGAWLYHSARSRAVEQVRLADTRRRHERAVATRAPEDPHDSPVVDEFIGNLGDELREPLILHFFRGLSQAQVAEELRLSQATVSRRIERAMELLRSRLETAGITAAPAVVLTSAPFAGDPLVAAELAHRTAAVVNGVHCASAVVAKGTQTWLLAKVAAGVLTAGAAAMIITAVAADPSSTPPVATAAAAPPASEPAAANEAEAPVISGYNVTVPTLGSVELVGICSDETIPPTWWSPDGKRLQVPPITKSSVPMGTLWEDRQCRRFVVQLAGPAAGRMYFWDFQPVYGSRWSNNPPMAGIVPRLDFKEAQAGFVDGTDRVTLRYGVASDKLETLLECDNSGAGATSSKHTRMVRVSDHGEVTVADFSVDIAEDNGAVITSFAVSHDGRWIEQSGSNRNPHDMIVDYQHTYPLPQNRIQRIVIQCRRYTHWVRWKNLPLSPGGDAQVSTSIEVIGR